jgi:small subunit ribosomal protein S23e
LNHVQTFPLPQNDGCLNFVDENDEVLISGFGRRGKAKGDIPGVRFKIVKVSGVGLLALWKEKKVRPRTNQVVCAF